VHFSAWPAVLRRLSARLVVGLQIRTRSP